MANIYETGLFPYITGEMLKERRVTLTIKWADVTVDEVNGKQLWQLQLGFEEREKIARLNQAQAIKLANVYGPDTQYWKGQPCTLYGEHGKWFGREQWALRVDQDETQKRHNTRLKQAEAREAEMAKRGSAVDAANEDLLQ